MPPAGPTFSGYLPGAAVPPTPPPATPATPGGPVIDGGLTFSSYLPGATTPPAQPALTPATPGGIVIDGGPTFSGYLPGALVPPTPPPATPATPGGPVIDGGLTFYGYLQPPDVPPDPTGNAWRGPPGAPGASAAVEYGAAVLSWPAAANIIVANGTYELALAWPWQSGAITGLTVATGRGSFVATVLADGVAVATAPVNSATPVTTPASIHALHQGVNVVLIISAAAGLPNDATVQTNYSRSPV